jgi:16S rRNA (guanine1516-N2)-methyltransferase
MIDCSLVRNKDRLELHLQHAKNLKPIYVDFLSKEMQFRCQHARIRNELLARAVGLLRKKHLKILDLTAGLGVDSYLLAYFGCEITMIERSPIIAALLEDGLQRAKITAAAKNISLIKEDSRNYLSTLNPEQYPDVIYMDPMFPEKTKSAKSRKEMRILHELVGDDLDAAELFSLALKKAKRRVVVKRPRLAASINQLTPQVMYSGGSSRFDVYLL